MSLSHVMDHASIVYQPGDAVGRKDGCYPGTSREVYPEARNYGSSYKQSRCLQVRVITGTYWREPSRSSRRCVDRRRWNPLCTLQARKRSSHESIKCENEESKLWTEKGFRSEWKDEEAFQRHFRGKKQKRLFPRGKSKSARRPNGNALRG